MNRSVYFIQHGEGGPIKIGMTKDPASRLKMFQAANPIPLVLLASAADRGGDEHLAHRLFREHRISGEWYHPASEILALVARIRRGEGFPWEPKSPRSGRAAVPASVALAAYLSAGATIDALASALGIVPTEVRSWADGSVIPRADHASRLQALTHGAVPADGWARP